MRALARYQEGVVTARKAARIAVHLSGCPVCSGSQSGLQAISLLLASASVPPIPQTVDERISAALAAEASARFGAPASPSRPATSHRRVRPARVPSTWSSPLILRGLSAAASVVVVVGVGFMLVRGTAGGPSSAHTSGTGLPTGRQASHANLPAYGGLPVPVGRGSTVALASGKNYTLANLASYVRLDIMNTSAHMLNGASLPSPGPFATKRAGRIPAFSQLRGCLTDVAHGRRVVVADVARYLGRPATIIVLKPLLAAASVFDVVIVGPACSATAEDVIYRATVPMP